MDLKYCPSLQVILLWTGSGWPTVKGQGSSTLDIMQAAWDKSHLCVMGESSETGGTLKADAFPHQWGHLQPGSSYTRGITVKRGIWGRGQERRGKKWGWFPLGDPWETRRTTPPLLGNPQLKVPQSSAPQHWPRAGTFRGTPLNWGSLEDQSEPSTGSANKSRAPYSEARADGRALWHHTELTPLTGHCSTVCSLHSSGKRETGSRIYTQTWAFTLYVQPPKEKQKHFTWNMREFFFIYTLPKMFKPIHTVLMFWQK